MGFALAHRFKRLFEKKRRPGSGLEARPIIRKLVWARRAAQVGFLGLFCWWLVHTGFRGNFSAVGERVRVDRPVEGFLLADPFVALMTLLSTHTIYRGLLWSVGVVALTLVFGRVFCGWICPFGTLHHFFGWILPSRYGKGAGLRVLADGKEIAALNTLGKITAKLPATAAPARSATRINYAVNNDGDYFPRFAASSTDCVANTTKVLSFLKTLSQSLIFGAKTGFPIKAQASSRTIIVGEPSSEL